MKQNYKDKIIESLISALILFFIPFVLSKINWENFNLAKSCPELFEPKISYFVLIISVVVAVVLIWLLNHIIHKSNCKQKKIEKELKKHNRWEYEKEGILVTWDVIAESYLDGNPVAINIQFFCTKHGEVPVRMVNGRCPRSGCPNANNIMNEHKMRNEIESMLLEVKRRLEK